MIVFFYNNSFLLKLQGWTQEDPTVIVWCRRWSSDGTFLVLSLSSFRFLDWTVNTTISLPMNHRSLNLTLNHLKQTEIHLGRSYFQNSIIFLSHCKHFLFEGALVSINNKEMRYCQNWSQAKVDKKLQSVQFTETQSSILHLFLKYWTKILNIYTNIKITNFLKSFSFTANWN